VLGLTTVAARAIFGRDAGFKIAGFGKVEVPGLFDLPFAGPAFFTQSGFVYAAPFVALAVAILLYRTTPGLALRAAGDEPRAVDKSGASVPGVRWLAILVTGLAAGLGGAVYSLADIHTFTENMTNGAGYLALAAVIFGGWNIGRTVAACLLFGAATALQFQLPAMGINVPTALLLMLPYLLALLAVAGVVGRLEPPTSLTLPFQRGK
jgi:simple sugar transport system permease protein